MRREHAGRVRVGPSLEASVCGVTGEGLAPLVSDAFVHSLRAATRAAFATATSRLVLPPVSHGKSRLLPTARCSRPDPTRTPNSSSPNRHSARHTLALPLPPPPPPPSQGKGMEAIPYYERSLLLRRDRFGLHSSQVSSVCKRLVLLYNSWSMKVHAWMKREG